MFKLLRTNTCLLYEKQYFWYFFVLKKLTLDKIWSEHVFICGGNPHITSRFCAVVLDLTTMSKMILESLQDLLDHLLSGFRYQVTHHLYEPNPIGLVVRGCVKESLMGQKMTYKCGQSSPQKPVLWDCVRRNHDF